MGRVRIGLWDRLSSTADLAPHWGPAGWGAGPWGAVRTPGGAPHPDGDPRLSSTIPLGWGTHRAPGTLVIGFINDGEAAHSPEAGANL